MSQVGATGVSLDDAFTLLYGVKASVEERARLRAIIGSERVRSLSDLRSIIMAHDRQSHPTRAIVRFDQSDLRRIDLEGFRLVLDVADPSVSTQILSQRVWEPHLTRVFRGYLRGGMRMADIGANVGYYTMLAATLVKAQGEVLAFEPNPENCRLLLLSISENAFANVRVIPLALGERTGFAHFSSHIGSNGGFVPEDSALTTGYGTIVPVARLDDLVTAPLDFVKMDVEGAEYRVLRGAQSVIGAARPVITTEFSCEMIGRVSERTPREFLEFFLRYGYTIHLVRKDAVELAPIVDVDAFLRDWGDPVRIEDLLMLPRGMPALA